MKCCMCEKTINNFGNNPYPVKEEGMCCDECNMKYVIPERMRRFKSKYKNFLRDCN